MNYLIGIKKPKWENWSKWKNGQIKSQSTSSASEAKKTASVDTPITMYPFELPKKGYPFQFWPP